MKQIKEDKSQLDYSYRILKFLGDLVAGADHEINNLLMMVEGSAHILLDNNPSPEKRAMAIDAITAKTRRIQEVMTELRSILKDGTDENYRTLTVKQLVGKAISLCKTRFKNHRIFFSINISEDLKVEGRETQLIQALLAILTMSHEAICKQKERWIRVDVLEMDEELAIRVEDSGRAFSEMDFTELYTPFYTSADGRQGVGLALAKNIIEGHKGVLELSNKEGTPVITFTLPKTQDPLKNAGQVAKFIKKIEIFDEQEQEVSYKRAA